MADHLNELGKQDPGSTKFRDVIAQTGLQEIGPSDCLFTWQGLADPMAHSRLDRFLCSVEKLKLFLAVVVTALPRPISCHTHIIWKSQGELDNMHL